VSRRVFYALNVRLAKPLEKCPEAARLAVEQKARKDAIAAGYEPEGKCIWECIDIEKYDYLCKQPAIAPSEPSNELRADASATRADKHSAQTNAPTSSSRGEAVSTSGLGSEGA
jgi:hypothetical protein